MNCFIKNVSLSPCHLKNECLKQSYTYSIQLSQLNLPRTPKFVICDWRLTYTRNAQYHRPTEFTVNSYTFFDFINSKCSYPTYTVWSHDQSGTDMIVDSIRDFTDKTTLYMHVQKNAEYLTYQTTK